MATFNLNLKGIVLKSNAIGSTPLAGIAVPILEWTVPKDATVRFPVTTGVILKLYTTEGTELPAKAQLYFAIQRPIEDTPKQITEKVSYQKFLTLDITDQTDVNKQPKISLVKALAAKLTTGETVALEAEGIRLKEGTKIMLMLETPQGSTAIFDPNNADNYLELVNVIVEGTA